MLDPQAVATALAPLGAPSANVLANWPIVAGALGWAGIDDPMTEIAAASTVNVESGSWRPIEEYGDWGYFLREFGSAYEATYHGRGYIQLSWSSNYAHYGTELGVDLLGNPALALQPETAARVLALYFREHGIPAMAAARNWYGCRVAVNGGTNGLGPFLDAVHALVPLPAGPPLHAVTRVAVRGALKTQPNHTCAAAIGPDHQPVVLQPATVVRFAPDPHTGRQVTPNWACVALPESPVWGWYPRTSLATTWEAAVAP